MSIPIEERRLSPAMVAVTAIVVFGAAPVAFVLELLGELRHAFGWAWWRSFGSAWQIVQTLWKNRRRS